MIRPYVGRAVEPYHPSVADIETRRDGSLLMIGFGWEVAGLLMYKTFDGWGEWLAFVQAHAPGNARMRQIYAHNGGGFDWLSLLEWMIAEGVGMDVKVIYSNTAVIGINVRLGKLRIQLRDSLRLLPASLAVLSETFNVDVRKVKIDVLPEQLYDADRGAFLEYLKADVQALQMVIKAFWASVVANVGNIGDLPMTLASLAMRLWRMGLDKDMWTPGGVKHKAFEREAYAGGRTQCFDSGSFDVTVYDMNSQYPSVMVDREYPVSYRGFWTTEYEGDHGLYRGSFWQPMAGGLPALLRDAGSGEYRHAGKGTFTKPEVDKLLELGGTFDCERGYIYVDMGSPFTAFIGRWWGVRQAAIARGDEGLAFTCKILMNSLYGKFAQKEQGWVCMTATPEDRERMHDEGRKFEDYGLFVVAEETIRAEHAFLGLAAYITAYARLALYDGMERIAESGGRVVYCDTDSLHVVGGELPTGKGLGGWKIEVQGLHHYAGKKLYAKDDGKVKSKGVGKLERGPLDAGDVARLARDRDAAHRVDFGAFPTWREVLLHGEKACALVGRHRTLRNTVAIAHSRDHAILVAS